LNAAAEEYGCLARLGGDWQMARGGAAMVPHFVHRLNMPAINPRRTARTEETT